MGLVWAGVCVCVINSIYLLHAALMAMAAVVALFVPARHSPAKLHDALPTYSGGVWAGPGWIGIALHYHCPVGVDMDAFGPDKMAIGAT